MTTLAIKTKDGKVIKGRYPLHAIMADELNIPFEIIVNVGFITKDKRIVWCDRKPH